MTNTTGEGMGRHALEKVLSDLAVVAEEVIAEAVAVEARMKVLSDICEARLGEGYSGEPPPLEPDPCRALETLRLDLAVEAARGHRSAAREFASWWADVATIATIAAATGQAISSVRVAAADPTIAIRGRDLQQLPPVPEEARELSRLAATMALTSIGQAGPDRKMVAEAHEHAARFGLRISYDNGDVQVLDDWTAEARRRRIWGDRWLDTRAPVLLEPDEVAELLTSCGAAAAVIETAVEATQAVQASVLALYRLKEIDADESGEVLQVGAEFDSLLKQSDQLTAHLGN